MDSVNVQSSVPEVAPNQLEVGGELHKSSGRDNLPVRARFFAHAGNVQEHVACTDEGAYATIGAHRGAKADVGAQEFRSTGTQGERPRWGIHKQREEGVDEVASEMDGESSTRYMLNSQAVSNSSHERSDAGSVHELDGEWGEYGSAADMTIRPKQHSTEVSKSADTSHLRQEINNFLSGTVDKILSLFGGDDGQRLAHHQNTRDNRRRSPQDRRETIYPRNCVLELPRDGESFGTKLSLSSK
jgi:hypothetical protein